jgi:hypothetical protein
MSSSIYYEGVGYEGGGFLRANTVFAMASSKTPSGPKKPYVAPEDAEIEKRERELRREYLPAWLCDVLDA